MKNKAIEVILYIKSQRSGDRSQTLLNDILDYVNSDKYSFNSLLAYVKNKKSDKMVKDNTLPWLEDGLKKIKNNKKYLP